MKRKLICSIMILAGAWLIGYSYPIGEHFDYTEMAFAYTGICFILFGGSGLVQ